MPKKLGINTKSVEAKLRKDAVKMAKAELTVRLKEDELWKDDDKHIQRKMNRKDEKEKKKQELSERKAGNKAILEEEMSSLKSSKNNEQKVAKITRNDINTFVEKQSNKTSLVNKNINEDQIPIEENVNRLIDEEESARNVDDAIAMLSVKEPELDRHPERRVKAAYTAFEDENLPRLKLENPNLRLSQLKQLLKKDWMKSPDNPLNQRHISYNSKN